MRVALAFMLFVLALAADAGAQRVPGVMPAPPEGAMPPDHPAVPGTPRPGHGGKGDDGGPKDVLQQDASVDVGGVDVTIAESDGTPVANVSVTLTIKFETVDLGQKESTQQGRSDDQGRVHFSGQKTGSSYKYRVTANREGASFPSPPFRLTQQGGVRVVLHTTAPVTKLEEVPLVVDAVLMLEIKGDSIAVTHIVRTVNLGKNAFITPGIVMPLPPDAVAFKEESSSDGIEVVERDGALLLKGTFAPGQANATYRYQVPITGDVQRMRLALPPRVITSRIMIGAGAGMTLQVAGYPPAVVNRVGDNKRVLETVKRVDIRGGMDGLLKITDPEILDIRIGGIPVPGPERMIALLLAGIILAAGVYHTYRTHGQAELLPEEQRQDLLEARSALLDEVAALERARRSGEVGPKSYERLRNALLDALARIVTQLDDKAAKSRSTSATSPASKRRGESKPGKGKRDSRARS